MEQCKKSFEVEFCYIERWAKFIGIPFFTIMSALFLTSAPGESSGRHFAYHIVFSFIGVVGIWFGVSAISAYFRKRCSANYFSFRLVFQILSSCALTTFIILALHFFGMRYFLPSPELDPDDFELKNVLLVSILLTFLIITIYESFYLFRRLTESALETERYKKESIEIKYQNLTSRLNPHFLFNSLNTLTTIVEEDSKKAVNYIQELSTVYRYVLNSQNNTWIDLPTEIAFTHSYISLLKMRFEENLNITMDICEKHQLYCILPLSIQLLLENAVKHNEISSNHPLEVKIFCSDEFLVVSNNKRKRKIMPSSTQFGLKNIRDRYKFLVNKEVTIEDTESAFTVKIPLIKTAS